MISNCPSGKLAFGPGYEHMEPEFDPSIATIKDGPLWVRGGIELVGDDGFVYETLNRLTLCRCGESKNKPYCDGAHDDIDFEAD